MLRAVLLFVLGISMSSASMVLPSDTGFGWRPVLWVGSILTLFTAALLIWTDGRQTGHREGWSNGFSHGITEGITRGYNKGLEIGRVTSGQPISQDCLPEADWAVLHYVEAQDLALLQQGDQSHGKVYLVRITAGQLILQHRPVVRTSQLKTTQGVSVVFHAA